LRLAAAWILSAALITVYLLLPNNDEDAAPDASVAAADSSDDPRKVEIVRVRPTDPAPGTAIAIAYSGTPRGKDVLRSPAASRSPSSRGGRAPSSRSFP